MFVAKHIIRRPVHLEFTLHEAPLGMKVRRGRLFFPASIIPPMLHFYSFIHHGPCVTLAIYSVVDNTLKV